MKKLVLTFLMLCVAAFYVGAYAETEKSVSALQTGKIPILSGTEKAGNHSPLKKVNVKRLPSPTITEAIVETPEGTLLKNMSRDGFYTYPFFNIYVRQDYRGMTCDMVETENALYIQRPITYYGEMSWIKLDKGDDGLYRAHLPQAIQGSWVYAVRLNINTLDFDKNADGEDIQDIAFTYKNGVLEQVDKDGVFALLMGEQVMAYMEGNLSMRPVTDKVTVIPDAARENITPYALRSIKSDSISSGQLVDLCFDGNTVYMNNPFTKLQNHWIKGEVNGSKIRFNKGQYFGPDPDNTCFHHYFAPAKLKIKRVEELDGVPIYMMEGTPLDVLEFDWDADLRTLTCDDDSGFLLTTNNETLTFMEGYLKPSLKFFDDSNSIPTNPIIDFPGSLVPYDENAGYGSLSFRLSSDDTAGEYIDSSKLYYNIYIDDRENPYVFNPRLYSDFQEEETDVPYTLNNYSTFQCIGDLRTVLLFIADYDYIGVQAVYKPERGDVRSEIVWYNTTGIKNTEADNREVASEEWYDLNGRKVTDPSAGIYLRRVIFTDGTSKNIKVFKTK